MKNKYLFAIFLMLVCFIICDFAQEKTVSETDGKWTRIETEDKDLSLAFPPNFIADAEKRDYGQRLNIFGFENDVTMQLKVFKDNDPKQRLQLINPPINMNPSSFTKGKLKGLRLSYSGADNIFKELIYLYDDNKFYIISVISPDKTKSQIERFLYSIKVSGEDLFTRKEPKNFPEEMVSFASLKTSPEIVEAYERKSDKKKPNVTKELALKIDEIESYEGYSRPPVILERPIPKLQLSSPTSDAINKSYTVKMRVNFLANGQIGDIKILFNQSDKNYEDACIEAARKIRFIPAQKNGVNADSTSIVDFTVRILPAGPRTGVPRLQF